ncbi:neocarzinostatin apoprotein domain-containing protein [Streptomyces katrae]|uniref:Neocarzinostatin apoprotein domain-containing protein n=1 Tax=Streptomyces katrae TaxID=68223 RepID=A0ABT7GSC0_9ACTN|nr:neocarzinostatin apoprotein domain-containing protein [Streptomyces katrae]MDK9495814.1 neocarzinostatin apoprotein domain-containing protein [Streptomyces katrae]
MSRTAGAKAASPLGAALAALALALLPLLPPLAAAAPAAAAEGKPAAALSLQEAAKGTEITVTGTGWRPKTLVMLLVCGQNMIGGTNSCANADGAAVSVTDDGRFTARLPVAEPPKPCPCVVNVTSVNGDQSTVAVPIRITGHPVADLPAESGTARLAMLTGVRLRGEDGVLTWFGAPPGRTFTATVGNLGSAPVKDPVFQLGTARGVFAPVWEEARWKGTIPPGGKAEVALDVALPAGAHGDYTVSLKYGDTVLAAQPWGVDRPYGVLLFWGLLLVVIPTALFRAGMAVVDRVRPRPGAPGRHRGPRAAPDPAAVTARLPRVTAAGAPPGAAPPALPWFTPQPQPQPQPRDAGPPQTSAPSDHSPTTKGPS